MAGIQDLWRSQKELMQHVVDDALSDAEIAEKVGCSERIVRITRNSRLAQECRENQQLKIDAMITITMGMTTQPQPRSSNEPIQRNVKYKIRNAIKIPPTISNISNNFLRGF